MTNAADCKSFDVLRDRRLRRIGCGPSAAIQQFLFERTEKALGDCVVEACASRTGRCTRAYAPQGATISVAGVSPPRSVIILSILRSSFATLACRTPASRSIALAVTIFGGGDRRHPPTVVLGMPSFARDILCPLRERADAAQIHSICPSRCCFVVIVPIDESNSSAFHLAITGDNLLDFEDPKVRLPTMRPKQRVMVGADSLRKRLPGRSGVEHTTHRGAIDVASMNSEANDATGVLVDDQHDPIRSHGDGFASK